MKQMIKETAPEVKREIPVKSTEKDRIHRYTNRRPLEVRLALMDKTPEECLEVIRRVKDIRLFPGTMLTNTLELGAYFEVDFTSSSVSRCKHYLGGTDQTQDIMPVYGGDEFMEMIDETAPEAKRFFSGNYIYYECSDGGGDAIRGCHQARKRHFQVITPQAIILIGYILANGFSEDRRRIAKLLVDEVEASDLLKAKPAPETPAEPTQESPKMDYAETLRKLFDSVLTLVEKQAEERGAEKIVQKLKDAGKL